MAKYYLQEMPDMDKGGKRRVYSKIQTNRQISTKELAEKIQKRSGVFKAKRWYGAWSCHSQTRSPVSWWHNNRQQPSKWRFAV